jgi:hypothetical protein
VVDDNKINALLKVNKFIAYHIDSIHLFGKAVLSKKFLQHFWVIPAGSLYNKERLQQVDKRLQQLPYVQAISSPVILPCSGTGSDFEFVPFSQSVVAKWMCCWVYCLAMALLINFN